MKKWWFILFLVVVCAVLILLFTLKIRSWVKRSRDRKRIRELDVMATQVESDRHVDTIFVSVPCYRETDAAKTMYDLLTKAKNPYRIRIGVCDQKEPQDDDTLKNVSALVERDPRLAFDKIMPHIRILQMPASQATGPMYARSAIEQRLYRGEKYYLCIDAHMRFADGWDEELVQQLEKGTRAPSRSVITMVPPAMPVSLLSLGFGEVRVPSSPSQRTPAPMTRFSRFEDENAAGLIEVDAVPMARCSREPLPTNYRIPGFAFCRGAAIREVPHDPFCSYVFLGELHLMSARYWTHGYDFYTPTRTLAWHDWSRHGRYGTFWEQFQGDPAREAIEQQGYERVLAVLGHRDISGDPSLPPFMKAGIGAGEMHGLGTRRTIRDFYRHVGADPATETVTTYGSLGLSPHLLTPQDVETRFGSVQKFEDEIKRRS